MKLIEAKEITGGLSRTSKLECGSFSLSAFDCVTGSKLAKVKDSVCNKCYARRNSYLYPSVKTAQARRIKKLNNPSWAEAMVKLIRIQALENDTDLFRWFDSGDLQEGMLAKIVEVCKLTPEIKHWLPTHEAGMIIKDKEKLGGKLPANLIIRLSASMIDGNPPKSWEYSSTVHKKTKPIGFLCKAKDQGGKCLDCTACWNKDIKNISYMQH
tara:strand:+ start:567 stop:1202 length:636 start_codon:yes stop_codon:yes gene_type:complete